MITKVAILNHHRRGFAVDISGDKRKWPIRKKFEVDLDDINTYPRNSRQAKKLTEDLSYLMGIEGEIEFRPDGFSATPDGTMDIKTIGSQIKKILQDILGRNIEVENYLIRN